MKKILLILSLVITCFHCKNETKAETETTTEANVETQSQDNDLDHFKGEFVYYDGAAVLQTGSEIYGVLFNNKLEELQTLAKKYKKEPTDMVDVEVKGTISTKKHETILWDKKIEITEILAVSPSAKEDNNTIKLGS